MWRKELIVVAVAVGAAIMPEGSEAQLVNTGPGKAAYFESANSYLIPNSSSAQLLPAFDESKVHILKGRKRRVLTVESTLTIPASAGPIALSIAAAANGIPMEPTSLSYPQGITQDCSGGMGQNNGPAPQYCTVSGTWWLDLDRHAELIGAPIKVTMVGGDVLGMTGPQAGHVSMSVRMEKH